jgi:hypothetical protein
MARVQRQLTPTHHVLHMLQKSRREMHSMSTETGVWMGLKAGLSAHSGGDDRNLFLPRNRALVVQVEYSQSFYCRSYHISRARRPDVISGRSNAFLNASASTERHRNILVGAEFLPIIPTGKRNPGMAYSRYRKHEV